MAETGTKAGAHDWVAALATPAGRDAAFAALVALGPAARPAVYAGLGDGRWEVRRWCLVWLCKNAQPDDAARIVPLLRDPRARVRHTAMIALRSAGRSDFVVPLLIERALADENLRTRRQAVALLAWDFAHPDLEGFFADLAARESDRTLRKYAGAGVLRSRAAGRPSC